MLYKANRNVVYKGKLFSKGREYELSKEELEQVGVDFEAVKGSTGAEGGDDDGEVNLEDLGKKELQALLDERGIAYKAKDTVATLRELAANADEAEGDDDGEGEGGDDDGDEDKGDENAEAEKTEGATRK